MNLEIKKAALKCCYRLFGLYVAASTLVACTAGVEGDFSSVGTAINDGSTPSNSFSSASFSSSSAPVTNQSSSASVSSQTGTNSNGDLLLNYKWPDEQTPNVALVNEIEVEFSEPLAQETNLNSLFVVTQSGQSITGMVSTNDNRLIRFKPNSLLPPNAQITVRLPAGLMSSTGDSFAGEQWQFTTTVDVYDTSQEVVDLCMNDLDLAMLAAVNTARSSDRYCTSSTANDYQPAVNKLRWSCAIQQAAIGHSEDMAVNNFFSHTGSDGSSLRDRIDGVGYNWWTIGENIAAGQSSVSEVMNGWLESYGHCVNIMNENFTEFGFGYVQVNTGYRRYWTQDFATPR